VTGVQTCALPIFKHHNDVDLNDLPNDDFYKYFKDGNFTDVEIQEYFKFIDQDANFPNPADRRKLMTQPSLAILWKKNKNGDIDYCPLSFTGGGGPVEVRNSFMPSGCGVDLVSMIKKLPDSDTDAGVAFWQKYEETFIEGALNNDGVLDFAATEKVDKFMKDLQDEGDAFLDEFVGDPNFVKAWEALFDFPNHRVLTNRLEDVSNYLIKNPGTENAIKQGLSDVGDYTDEFLNGIKNATEDLSHLGGRSALPDEIADGVNRIKAHRNSVGSPNAGNYGYLEGNVNGSSVDNKMWRSGEADPEVEPQIFDAIEVEGSGGNSWLRNTDSEYKMLNQLADDLGGVSGNTYPNISGSLKIVSERPYCPSCQGVIQQFHEMFPNIDLILVDGVR